MQENHNHSRNFGLAFDYNNLKSSDHHLSVKKPLIWHGLSNNTCQLTAIVR